MVVQKHISICKQPINIWINEHYIRSSHYITASISFISINSVTTWQTQPQSGARNVIPLIGHITFLLLQKHLTSGTELILTGWKIVPNEEHVQCDHRFASQPLANKPLPPLEARKCSAVQGPHSEVVPRAFWRRVSKSCDECKGSFARGCEAKRWSHWTCSSLGTIFQPMRINSVPDVKCFCNNKNVFRAQWTVRHFVRHPVFQFCLFTPTKLARDFWSTTEHIFKTERHLCWLNYSLI